MDVGLSHPRPTPSRIDRFRQRIAQFGFGLWAAALTRRVVVESPGSLAYRLRVPSRLFASICVWIDRDIGWHRLPTWLGWPVLVGVRMRLRAFNLHDTAWLPTVSSPDVAVFGTEYLAQRRADGTFDDLRDPRMGSAGARFGRNIRLELSFAESESRILEPNPRTISRELLTRETFAPAMSLNMLAAAWIQFVIRDWFNHGSGDISNPWQIPLAADDPFPQNPMLVPRALADPTRADVDRAYPPTHINLETGWLDASQLYPNDTQLQSSLRVGVGGALRLVRTAAGDSLPPPLLAQYAQMPGWWLGLGLLQTLFVREHNAICAMLSERYPSFSDEQLFQRAHLVLAALIAKIHTTEWTCAALDHPSSVASMRANWLGSSGPFARGVRLVFPGFARPIPGSPTDHHAAPYSMTEEFVALCRMHSLIRDDYSLRRAANDEHFQDRGFPDIADSRGNEMLLGEPNADLLYSFGTLYPGALQLHNYPRFLQSFTRPDGRIIDLAAIDILRTRECGVPRYAQFRHLFHLRPVTQFADISDDPALVGQLREVYEGRPEDVDLVVGLLAEPKPEGLAVSDTAFHVFVLMFARMLKSDRYFTTDYTPQVYTPEGLQWVVENTFADVLRRHHPQLIDPLGGVTNAFQPWRNARA